MKRFKRETLPDDIDELKDIVLWLQDQNTKLVAEAPKKKKLQKPEKYWKKFVKSLVSEGKKKKNKFRGDVTVMVERFSKDEYDLLFANKGTKIQPLPNFKPKSTVHISKFDDFEAVTELFTGATVPETVTIQRWSIGGFRRGKSVYLGTGTANIQGLNVEWNKSKEKLKLIFNCDNDYGGHGGGPYFLFGF